MLMLIDDQQAIHPNQVDIIHSAFAPNEKGLSITPTPLRLLIWTADEKIFSKRLV
jgi:hypothetical protein